VKDLDDGPWKTRIAEPLPSRGYLSWHGDKAARAAVYGNRSRLRSGVGKEAMRKRPSPQHQIDVTKEWTEGRWHISSVIFDPAPKERIDLASDVGLRHICSAAKF
jgi:hypothetical protein